MLSGSLDAFALPDVFSLLAATKKTGTLHIRTPRGEGWLEFRDGEIAFAVSDTRRMALARRLLGGGLLDDAQLRHVVAAQRGGAATLSTALVQEQIVDEATFDAMMREQIQDAVFELMRQTEGTFSFNMTAPSDSVRVTISTAQLVAEGEQRLRQWHEIASNIVSFDAIVTLAPQPPSESVTVAMDQERWRLLTFVDGRRTVRELVELTGQGEYAACQVVAGLIEGGLVEVVDPAAGRQTGVAALVARHDLLHRLEERELNPGARERPVIEPVPVRRTEVAPVAPTEEPPAAAEEPEDQPEPPQEAAPEEPAEPAPEAAEDSDDVVVGYREDEQPPRSQLDMESEGEAFDREEVERELASLGYRRNPEIDDDEEEDQVSPFRINRAEEMNRGLLNRLIDIRKQPQE